MDVRSRLRAHLRTRATVLRGVWIRVLQIGIAASVSWFIAYDVLGHTKTFFAPVASTVVLSLVPGERSRRAFEMVLGIAVGIAVADIIIQTIGTGAVQIGVIVMLAVSAAILLGAGQLIASQAAATAVLVAALPASHQAFTRFTDALVGGLVGLAVLVLVPRDPVVQIRGVVESLLSEAGGTLEDVATALERRDVELATAAIARATGAGELGGRFRTMLRESRETTLIAPTAWTARIPVDRYVEAARHIDDAVRNIRVLARAARTAIEAGDAQPDGLATAVRELGLAVKSLAADVPHDADTDVVERALGAASAANACLAAQPGLAISVVIAQVRSIAVDLLRALGAERLDASAHVRAAAVDPQRT